MKDFTLILVFDQSDENLLLCKRVKPPYLGLYNAVGGKIEQGEDPLDGAYRELSEETRIGTQDTRLTHLATHEYPLDDIRLYWYAGRLNKQPALIPETHPLHWLPICENYYDFKRFAGNGNIGHMLSQILLYHKLTVLGLTKIVFVPMQKEYIEKITAWKYPKPYDFYDMDADPADILEMENGEYYAALDEESGELVGFACYGKSATIKAVESNPYEAGFMDIGFGLRPDLCGRGNGQGFLRAIMEHGQTKLRAKRYRLTVACFNARAISVYEKEGFTIQQKVHLRSNKTPFYIMTKPS